MKTAVLAVFFHLQESVNGVKSFGQHTGKSFQTLLRKGNKCGMLKLLRG